MRIRSFNAMRPGPAQAPVVSAPPYDVVSRAEARDLLKANPMSFMRVTRPDGLLEDNVAADDPRVYTTAAEAMRAFLDQGLLKPAGKDLFYLYRQSVGSHAQTGVVALCAVEDYEKGLIKKHEKTRAVPEADRTRHMHAVGAHTGLVFLAYRGEEAIDRLVDEAMQAEPLYRFTSSDGVTHEVWVVAEGEALAEAFVPVPALYIADGHHRAASSARVARERGERDPQHPCNWFPAVLFPKEQLRILAYNRLVQDLNGMTPEAFLVCLRERFDVSEDVAPEPTAPHHVSMYLGGRWYGLSWTPDVDAGPVAALDVSVLQERVLEPLLGIDDPRANPRIECVGGVHGTDVLVRRVDAGEAAVAFSMYPTSMDDLLAVADAALDMPPKSTWFEPKLRSGLLVHVFDQPED